MESQKTSGMFRTVIRKVSVFDHKYFNRFICWKKIQDNQIPCVDFETRFCCPKTSRRKRESNDITEQSVNGLDFTEPSIENPGWWKLR